MSESFIEPSSLNTTFQSLSAIIDDGGATRFLNSELSSYNFDGFIPQETDTIAVSLLKVGNSFLAPGDSLGTLRTVLKIEFDDPEMTDSPTTNYIISYLGDGGEVQSVVYDATDEVEIYYEDWDNKVLGSNGWIITQAGNAIFSNVAIRGRIEATEGFLEDLDITGTLNMDTGGVINIGTDPGTPGNAGIIINESGIFAYDDDENETISIDAATGEIVIGALEEELENFVTTEDLTSGSYVTNAKLVDGTTRISGTNIQTGTVNANLVNVVNINAGNINAGSINAITFQTNSSGRRSRLGVGNAYVPDNWAQTVTPRSGGAGTTTYSTTGLEFFDQNNARTGYMYSADRYNSGVFQSGSRLLILGSTDSAGSDTGNEIIIGHNYLQVYSSNELDLKSTNGTRLFSDSPTTGNSAFLNVGTGTSGNIYMEAESEINVVTSSVDFFANIYVRPGYKYYGDGSALTGVGSPIIVATTGPTNPSAYVDNTVWYVV